MKKHLLWSILLLPLSLFSNNLKIKDLRYISASQLTFRVSWNNSWNLEGVRTPYNHDAVWIFFKYRQAGKSWKHLKLSPLNRSHFSGDSTLLEVNGVKDKMGVIVHPARPWEGDITGKKITVGLDRALENDFYDIRVFGIEMVYIPRGAYYLGDEASNNTFREGDSGKPYRVDSSGKIPVGNGPGQLTSRDKYAPASDIPASFPNGFNAYYVMKYEISQQQYADFLNTLAPAQQSARIAVSPDAKAGTYVMSGVKKNRNGIVIASPGGSGKTAVFACNAINDGQGNDQYNDGQNRACNFLSWNDLAAYLDWAGLRPVTELEFEKICRGLAKPVKKEFAWGTSGITDANTIIKDGTPLERAVDTLLPGSGLASHGYQGPQGPLRSGFGTRDSSGRLQAGAAYYGVFEMSGNLWELVVSVNKAGLNFTGDLGDGSPGTEGSANVPGWPGKDAAGSGYRGGAWLSGILDDFRDLAVSDRFYAFKKAGERRATSGGRGVRQILK